MSQAASSVAYIPSEVAAKSPVWPHRLAIVLTVLTFLLILAGGNVTSKGAGLAVPDWPLSFNSANPSGWVTNMDGTRPGVRDEHGHRLIGAAVGLVVIGLVVSLRLQERRAWVRNLGFVALAAVIVQGVMGGLRVTEKSTALAIVHGCFAQAFFCLTIALAMVTSPSWPGGAPFGGVDSGRDRALRTWAVALAGAVYLQLILGALVRHTNSSTVAMLHIFGALMVGACLIQVAQHVFARTESERPMGRLIIALFALFGLQLFLGVMTYVLVMPMPVRNPTTLVQVYEPTVHVAVGAVILGVSFAVALRAMTLTRRSAAGTLPEVAGA